MHPRIQSSSIRNIHKAFTLCIYREQRDSSNGKQGPNWVASALQPRLHFNIYLTRAMNFLFQRYLECCVYNLVIAKKSFGNYKLKHIRKILILA